MTSKRNVHLSNNAINNEYKLDHEHEHEHNFVQSPSIRVEENTIYFYSGIEDSSALELNNLLRKLDVEMQYLSLRLGNHALIPIHLRICSPGGSIFSGLSIVDAMNCSKTPIYTYIDGYAGSAATLVSASGTKGHRYIGKNGFALLHQPRMVWCGKLDEFHDEVKNMENIYEKYSAVYLNTTNFGKEELDELMQHELWLNAEQCLEKGLVDRLE
jgi:ATP-dependent Clp protease protease subunit